ncbi:NUDIX domain-containing protein [Streptomyces sp. CMB-StM0423]|uniref:NUDIX domain-containing protein n=1 Tax=Streptomyces sp. CMB-StM0423 TaxID=2059884 RepID=UPI001F30ADA0|nr:NUDIX domain-containing protein [Streptomyces sp. CMB-StM0423]
MHLRDDKEGIWAPSTWAPLGGGAEPGDADPLATGVRELDEETGLKDIALAPMFRILSDGYPVHIFHGRWDGDPDTLILTEGTDLTFINPRDMRRLPMSPLARYAALRGLSADLEDRAHADGIRDLLSAALILRDDTILFVRRRPEDCLGGTSELPSGKREKNESILDCPTRKVCGTISLPLTSVDQYLATSMTPTHAAASAASSSSP